MAVEIEPLFQKCLKFGFQNKTVENCLSLFLMTSRISKMKNGLDDINDKCRRYVELCFERAVEHSVNEASSMPFQALKYFLRSKSLNISGERFIWSLIESWVQRDPSGRMPNVPELLTYLCLHEIDDELAAEIITSPIIRRNSLYKTLGDPNVALSYLSDKRKAEIVLHYNNVPPINSGVRLPQSVYFVLKEELNSHGRYDRVMFLSYDDNLDVWRKLGEINFRVFKILRIGHRLYIFNLEYLIIDGFHASERYVKGVLIYDLWKNESKLMSQTPLTPMPCFSSFYVEALSNIYFLKSYYQRPILLQQYVEEKETWISITNRQAMDILAAVGFDDLIYVIGMREELMILEVYDPFSNTWIALSSPHVRRSGKAEAVVYQKKIFLIGGHTDNEFYTRVVEVYDPIRNEWMTFPNLPNVVIDPTCTVVKGRLYVYKKQDFLRQHLLLGTYWDGSGEWKVINGQSSLRLLSICAIEGEDVVRGIMEKNKAVDISEWKETDGLEKEMLLKSND